MKTTVTLRSFLVCVGSSLLGASSVNAASGTWNQTGAGPFNWTDPANWTSGTIADGTGFTASFTANITALQVVNLNGDRTIGNITFTDSTTVNNNLTLSGNILTLDVSTGAPIIDVTQSGRTLTINSTVAGSDGLQKNGSGTLALGSASTYSGTTSIYGGSLVMNHANALPGALTFNTTGTGGVLGLGVGDFTRSLGSGPDQVLFTEKGGWAAYGADRTVNLGGNVTPDTVIWGDATTGFNGKTLVLGNSTSTHKATLVNPLDLGSGNRTVTVDDGAGSVDGELSGVLSGTGNLAKSNGGTLSLTNANTYSGTTTINGGALVLNHTTALPGGIGDTGGALIFGGGVLGLTDQTGNFSRSLGTGIGTVNFTGAGGWAAYGADRTVNLGGASATVIWADATTGLNGQTLILGSNSATHKLILVNNLDMGSATRTVQVENGAATVDAELSGVLSNSGGGLTKTGSGTLLLSNSGNSYIGATTITGGLIIQHADALGGGGTTVNSTGQLQLQGGISFAAEALTLQTSSSGTSVTLRNISGNNTWNGSITASGGGTNHLNRIQSESGTLLTLAGTMTGVANNNFVLQGEGLINVTGRITGPSGVISGTGGGATGVRTLSSSNDYTGTTSVTGGVLVLNHATAAPGGIGATGGTSNISLGGGVLGLGKDNSNFNRGLGTLGNQVQIISNNSGFAAFEADRTVNIGGLVTPQTLDWGTAGFMLNGTTVQTNLALSSATATHTVDFQNPINLLPSGVANGLRIFTIGDGSADVDAILSGALTGAISPGFSKAGTGTLVLSNTGNSYSNGTFIDSGTLRMGAAGVIPDGSTVTVKRSNGAPAGASAVLDLGGFNETIGGLALGEGTTTGSNSGQTPAVINSGGAATLTLGGGITYNAGSTGIENGQATISANLATGTTGNRDITVGNGSAATDLLISGSISGGDITKLGEGTLELRGTHTYTGTTTVSAGTLALGSTGSLSSSQIALNGGTFNVSAVTG